MLINDLVNELKRVEALDNQHGKALDTIVTQAKTIDALQKEVNTGACHLSAFRVEKALRKQETARADSVMVLNDSLTRRVAELILDRDDWKTAHDLRREERDRFRIQLEKARRDVTATADHADKIIEELRDQLNRDQAVWSMSETAYITLIQKLEATITRYKQAAEAYVKEVL